jgi:hypothetical protein
MVRVRWGVSMSRCAGVLVASLVSLTTAGGCSRRPATSESVVVVAANLVGAAPARTFTATITTPHSVSPLTVVLGANGSLAVGSGAKINGPGATISIATNMGPSGVNVQPDVVMGTVYSASPVSLGDRDHLLGKVVAAKTTQGNGVHVDGGLDIKTAVTPATITTWTVTYPAATVANVVVPVNGTSTSPPGRYGMFQVFSGGTLKLSPGTYFIDSLDLEPGAKLVLNQDAGPVVLYVSSSVIYRGAISTTSGVAPDLLFGYFGTADLSIEAPFVGTIVAPSAKIVLRTVTGGHTGAFFGANVEVSSNAIVTYRPANVIVTVQPGGAVDTCAAAVQPNHALSGNALELQFQSDILRYCTGTHITSCERTIRARMNVDFFMAASSVLSSHMTTGQYQQVVIDRDTKLASFRQNATLACNVAAHDVDGDYVPDDKDACNNTPPLTPVLANGCTNTQLPTGPDINRLQNVVKLIGLSVDPRCVNAPQPAVPAPLGAFRSNDPGLGKAIWVSRDSGTTTCPLYYQIEARITDGSPPRSMLFQASEDTTLGWITRPSGAVQFNLHTGDGGNRGAWASYSVFTITFRVRALNLAGGVSEWSDFFEFDNVDCVAGQPCQDL